MRTPGPSKSNYRFLVQIPGRVGLASLSWNYIERPIMELRRRMPTPTMPEIAPEAPVAAVAGEG